MEDEEQRGRSSRIPEDGYRKRDYSLRMEDESRRRQSHKNNNIRKDIKEVYKVIYRLLDGVVEHEEYEKLFEAEEYIKEF